MPVYTFSAAVESLNIEDTAQLAGLYTEEIDIYPSSIDGAVSVTFEVEAECGEDAVHRALKHMNAAAPQAHVTRLDECLVNATDIAERLSVSRETVRLWATGARGEGFPSPRTTISGGLRLWTWASVFAWAEAVGRVPLDGPRPVDDACIDWFNGQLAARVVLTSPTITSRTTSARFVTDRQHGIADHWAVAGTAEATFDEFPARDGSQWIFDGRGGLLRTGNRPRYR